MVPSHVHECSYMLCWYVRAQVGDNAGMQCSDGIGLLCGTATGAFSRGQICCDAVLAWQLLLALQAFVESMQTCLVFEHQHTYSCTGPCGNASEVRLLRYAGTELLLVRVII